MSRISALKNKISKLEVEVKRLQHRYSAKFVADLDKEILKLKQEVKSKQITIDSLEFNVDRTEGKFKNATEIIIKLGNDIKVLEDKKIKNRLKKLLAG